MAPKNIKPVAKKAEPVRKYKSVLEEMREKNKFINFKSGAFFVVLGTFVMYASRIPFLPKIDDPFILPETREPGVLDHSMRLVMEIGIALIVLGVGVIIAKTLTGKRRKSKHT
jgi:hypothetical protein